MSEKVIVKRKVVEIDEARCNGCGQCIPNCREGALEIVDGKARLVKDQFCDGLGACLGHCPQDAIRIVEREAEIFSEGAVHEHLNQTPAQAPARPVMPAAGCPSSRAFSMTQRLREKRPSASSSEPAVSELTNWPVQLSLVPVQAPYLKKADLLIAADCVAFSLPDFHARLLQGKILIIACPKLDNASAYTEKLAQIFAHNDIRSLTIAHMEVPCCFGLRTIIDEAIEKSGKNVKTEEVVVTIEGKIKNS